MSAEHSDPARAPWAQTGHSDFIRYSCANPQPSAEVWEASAGAGRWCRCRSERRAARPALACGAVVAATEGAQGEVRVQDEGCAVGQSDGGRRART